MMIDLSCRKEEWDAYVAGHDRSIYAHLSAWGNSLCETYDLRMIRIMARVSEKNYAPGGVLPLILVDAPDTPRRLISLPYTDAAGILADNDALAGELLTAACRLAGDLEAEHLEIRQPGSLVETDDGLKTITGDYNHQVFDFKVGLSRMLPASKDMLWQDIGPKVRNQVRKADKCGCRAIIGGKELADDFYAVFSENMRDLGSPVHDRRLFTHLAEAFSDQMRFVIIMNGTIPAAASAVFIHNRVIYNPYASSLRRFRPDCPNMLLYWAMLGCAIDMGGEKFDFGRSSPGASTCRFKQQWGAIMQPLSWHVFSKHSSQWHPDRERLIYEHIKDMSVEESIQSGPGMRKWISL